MGMLQLVKFPTWSRIVEGLIRTSSINHLYTNDQTLISSIGSTEPGIGDHLIIHFEIEFKIEEPTPIIKRAWKHYSKENLNKKLGSVSWDIGSIDVQGYWNTFEEKLVTIVDQVAPYSTFTNRTNVKAKTPSAIKNQLSTRKKLLKSFNKINLVFMVEIKFLSLSTL